MRDDVECDGGVRPVNQRIKAVEPRVSKNQVARRIKKGYVEFHKVDIAGGKSDEQPNLLVDQG